MKKEILEKIDLLVEMSGSTSSYENLQEEYLNLTQEIDQKKNQLKTLKRNIGSSKYVKANERIIDENIKIGLENRLSSQREIEEELLSSIDLESSKEEKIHNKIVSFENDLSQLNRYIDSLNLKLKTSSKNEGSYQKYQELLDEAFQEKSQTEQLLKDMEKMYSEITRSLANLGQQRAQLENSIFLDQEKLKELEVKLSNPSSYVDKKAQRKDESLVDSYSKELEELEQRKLEILTDPSYIGHEAQELYLDEDITSSLEKVKELVTIVESKPYMDVPSSQLASLLEDAEQKRDAFASEIENKKYDGSDLAILQTRISYLEEEVVKCEKEKQRIASYVSQIDTKEVVELVAHVAEAKRVRDLLRNDLEDYNRVLEENKDVKSPRKKASLQAALKKKQEELVMVEKVLEQFEKDLENKIIESKELEENDEISRRIDSLNEEISLLKKEMALNSRGKDILAVEKDKETLKNYTDIVSDIEHRKHYKESPSEVYNEIEAIIGGKEVEKETKEETEYPIDLDAYKIDFVPEEENIKEENEEKMGENTEVTSLDDIFSLVEETPEVDVSDPKEETEVQEENSSLDVPVVEEIPFEQNSLNHDVHEEPPSLDTMFQNSTLESQEVGPSFSESDFDVQEPVSVEEIVPALDNLPEIPDFPPRVPAFDEEPHLNNSNSHKVVQIEDLDESPSVSDEVENEELPSEEVMINDFEDTDYISFNDLLEGDTHENEN